MPPRRLRRLAAFWQDWVERFRANLRREEVVIRLAPEALDLVRRLFDPEIARLAREAASEADGWRRVTIPIESVEHARVDLLRLGAGVEVLAPPALRERMRQSATALARLDGAG